ncbi:MAG TPA: YihY/virulence factor BrkB family protein [Candidatus Ozemobacteraceae bacterium]|nr:YihY/virulence factor BrkB family protein [Candidatus Ozemobacteraceae bacterium]
MKRIRAVLPERVDRLLRLVVVINQRFAETEALEAAAAIAYYAIFSLFPLLLFLIAIYSSVLQSNELQAQVLAYCDQFFPGSRTIVSENIRQVIELRGTVGLVGMAVLLWSATGVFAGIAQNINQAWKDAPARHFLHERFLALTMIAGLICFVVVSLVVTAGLNLAIQISASMGHEVMAGMSRAGRWLVLLTPFFGIFTLFSLLYRFVPNTRVRWREAVAGALCAASCWEVTKEIFTWFLGSDWNSYQLVYGSLAAVVALLLWVYICGIIILLGAHLSAGIALVYREDAGA